MLLDIFQYIINHYQPATQPAYTATSDINQPIGEGDVLYYCDLTRLSKVEGTDPFGNPETVWQSSTDDRETWKLDDYDECNLKGVTVATFSSVTLASTQREQTPYSIIQICPWFLKQVCLIFYQCGVLVVEVNFQKRLWQFKLILIPLLARKSQIPQSLWVAKILVVLLD